MAQRKIIVEGRDPHKATQNKFFEREERGDDYFHIAWCILGKLRAKPVRRCIDVATEDGPVV